MTSAMQNTVNVPTTKYTNTTMTTPAMQNTVNVPTTKYTSTAMTTSAMQNTECSNYKLH